MARSKVTKEMIVEIMQSDTYPVSFRSVVGLKLIEQKIVNFDWAMRSNLQMPNPETIERTKEPFNGYDLWNIMTQVATHEIPGFQSRHTAEEAIAKQILAA
jgi:hypothetical protein